MSRPSPELTQKITMALTIRITPKDTDSHGHHGAAIQHAIDTVSAQRGGTIRLAAGTYILRGPLRMKSHARLEGEGESTVLTGVPFVCSPLKEDADIGQKEIHPQSTDGFLPGSGLTLLDKRKGSAMAKVPFTIQHVQNGVIYLDEFNHTDWIAEEGGLAMNYFPFIVIQNAHRVEIADLRIDQKRADDAVALERDVWGAGIYARYSEDILLERLIVENAYGDGLRCGGCLGVRWISCTVRNNTHYGVHPGSHTKRVVLEDSEIHGNGSDGVYVCWGVDHSVYRRNHIHHNGHRIHRTGFCIGHKDTDSLVEDNHIHDNAKHGIHIRIKTEANGAHRNTFRNNLVENNGRPWAEVPQHLKDLVPHHSLEGAGIFINGVTRDLVFENNTIRNSNGMQKRGIHVGPGVINPVFTGNKISGHEIDFEDARQG